MVDYLTATCLFCLDIDGLGLDVPPGSPSSVRSSGDGSSCDTPPVNQCSSSTEDGRTDRGKYCDCCYCEFFGHAAVSTVAGIFSINCLMSNGKSIGLNGSLEWKLNGDALHNLELSFWYRSLQNTVWRNQQQIFDLRPRKKIFQWLNSLSSFITLES